MRKLSYYRKKRMVLSAVIFGLVIVPTITFTVRRVMRAEDVSAVTYEIPSGYTTIVDANFYDCVATEFVKEYPSEGIPATGLTDTQLAKITSLKCNSPFKPDSEKIADATGIEKMTALTKLEMTWQKLTALDVSNNTGLTSLVVYHNNLTTLDVSNHAELKDLDVSYNNLIAIDVSSNTRLSSLDVGKNNLTALDVSNNRALGLLYAYNNDLTAIDVSNNRALSSLWVSDNNLTAIDVSNNTELHWLNVSNNNLTALDVSNNTNLNELNVSNNNLTALDVSNNTNLNELNVSNNNLTALDVSNNTGLYNLNVSDNNLTALDVSNNTGLYNLNVSNNNLTALDISNNTELYEFHVDDILVRTNFELTSMTPSITLSLTNLKIFDSDYFIDNANNYTYDTSSKVVTINHLDGLNAYIPTYSYYGNFKLQIPNFVGFDINNGEGELEIQSCYPDFGVTECSVVLSTDSPTREGHIFLGWAETANATEATYQPGETITLNGSKTLYAVWNPIHSLVFDTNNGTGAVESQTCSSATTTTAGCSVTIPATQPTRSNYRFLGWAETPNATEATHQPGETITLNETKTLYAVWNPIHSLVFDTSNGTGAVESQTCSSATTTTAGCSVTIPATQPTRSNYRFLGWAETPNATEATHQPGETITLNETKTLYAVWSSTNSDDIGGSDDGGGSGDSGDSGNNDGSGNNGNNNDGSGNNGNNNGSSDNGANSNGNNGNGANGSGGNDTDGKSGTISGGDGNADGSGGASNGSDTITSNNPRVTTPDTGRNTAVDEGGAMIMSCVPLMIVLSILTRWGYVSRRRKNISKSLLKV